MPKYGQIVVWTQWDGSKSRIEVSDCATSEEATQEAFHMAIDMGWTPPRWWQWLWRWDDTPAPKMPIVHMKSYREWLRGKRWKTE